MSNVTVLMHKREDGVFTARVKQEAADGTVYGNNILASRRLTWSFAAEEAVKFALNGSVEHINFEYD